MRITLLGPKGFRSKPFWTALRNAVPRNLCHQGLTEHAGAVNQCPKGASSWVYTAALIAKSPLRSDEVVDFVPKAILDRPSIYIAEDGDHINIELPNLSITIKKK